MEREDAEPRKARPLAYASGYRQIKSEATTPLYEAIKKGIKWESQVDLLLEYGATLDETCIEAAKISGDDKMIEKINSLMQEKRGAK